MKEIIIFARAGQGAITTAQVLGSALVKSGLYAYAFPHFGAARMGAPMNAFLRYDTNPIRLRTKIKLADYSIVVDDTLFSEQQPYESLKPSGICLINSQKEYKSFDNKKVISIPANKISQDTVGKTIANTVLLGSLCVVCNDLKIDLLYESIKERFKGETQQVNLKLAQAGYEYLKAKV